MWSSYHITQNHYFKVNAYNVKPRNPGGLLALDGESYPLEEYSVEVLERLGTFLSPYGHYLVDFKVPPTDKGDNL